MLDIENIRNDFPMLKNNRNLVYFDNSATTFKPLSVIDKINEFYVKNTSNVHRGDYDLSYKISKAYDDTRNTVQKFINANDSKEIVFTSGATESLNFVAYGYGLKHLNKGDVILTTLEEHASNILPWFNVAKIKGIEIEYIKMNDDGSFNIDNYIKCFENKRIKVVSLAHVSNVMGYVNPIKEICKIAHSNGAIVNVDGAQSIPHIKVDVKDLDIDFLSFSSHKMCGPSGVGVLYGKYDLLQDLDPVLMGGGANARFDKEGNIILKNAPEKFEAGTPNVEGILGLKTAIDYLENIGMNNIEEYALYLSNYFMDKFLKLNNVELYNKDAKTGIVTFNVKGIFAQDVASYLNKNGFAVRSGNHCAKMLFNIIEVTETIRASLYFYNTKEEIDKFIDVMKDITLEKCVESIL